MQTTTYIISFPRRLAGLIRLLFPPRTLRGRALRKLLGVIIRPYGTLSDKDFLALSSAPGGIQTFLTKDPIRNSADVKSILLIKLDHIGDFVIALPAFQLIRRSFPTAAITLLCGKWNIDMAEKVGLFDTIVPLSFFPEISHLCAGPNSYVSPDVKDVLQKLALYDIAIDLKVEDETRLLLRHVLAKYKAGFVSSYAPDDMALALPRPDLKTLANLRDEHHTRRLLYSLASAVVGDFEDLGKTYQSLSLIAESSPLPKEFPVGRRLIGINIGAGASIKKWPLKYYADLINKLGQEQDSTFILFGSKSEEQENLELLSKVGGSDIINYVGQISLVELAQTIKHLSLYIGNDTGTTHIAAGLMAPTICIFSGAGPLGRFMPSGENVVTVYENVPCAPCNIKKPENCRFGHYCMEGIQVEYVYSKAKKMLDQPKSLFAEMQ